MALNATDALREAFPDVARDIKLNLSSTLQPGTLSAAQAYGTAIASAIATRNQPLAKALIADAEADGVEAGTIDDAKAAAVLMGMNNVYYRFRHMIEKESYAQKSARLRMLRINQTQGPKAEFELFCLAVSAINGCQMCMQSHEAVVIEGGLSEDHVHDAVRIAATVSAAAIAMQLP
jgi:alkyl hydroperoxide reductase subunit D